MRYLRAFFGFWYDFLVGDKWELFVGPIVALAAVWLLVRADLPGAISGTILFGAVCLVGLISLSLSTRQAAR